MSTNTTSRRDRFYRNYGRRLRLTREVRKITEIDAAATFGVTLRTYRRYEAGRYHRGKYPGMLAFSRTYNVDLEWMLGGKGTRPGPSAVRKAVRS